MSDKTVLQQGDKIGSKGDKGDKGAKGDTGAAGQPRNILSIEGIYTTQAGSPFLVLAKTQVIEQGDTNFWKPSSGFSYVEDGSVAITTLSNFLVDVTKKYTAHIQRTGLLYSGITLPTNQVGALIDVEFFKLGQDSLSWYLRFNEGDPPALRSVLPSTQAGDTFQFSLTIFGTDQ